MLNFKSFSNILLQAFDRVVIVLVMLPWIVSILYVFQEFNVAYIKRYFGNL